MISVSFCLQGDWQLPSLDLYAVYRHTYCVIPAHLRAGRNSHLKATILIRTLAASVSYAPFVCTGLILRGIQAPKHSYSRTM